jgi:hypothetical protein
MTGAGHRGHERRVPLTARSIGHVSLFGLIFLAWFCRSQHGIFQMPPVRVKLARAVPAPLRVPLSYKGAGTPSLLAGAAGFSFFKRTFRDGSSMIAERSPLIDSRW